MVVIEQGQIVESGQVWSVFSNPVQPITQELLNLEQPGFTISSAFIPSSRLHSIMILKLKYQSDAQHAPDLTQLLASFDTPVYLYQSHVDNIQQHLIGSWVVGIPRLNLDLNHLKQQLTSLIQHIEVIGYARPTH